MTSAERGQQAAQRILAGQAAAIARAITWVENGASEASTLLTALAPHLGKAHRIGVTGPPGAGKSTLVDGLAREARKAGETVGIVAVDPSSPFTGGALLGDRVRMAISLEDPDVFVRSMANRGCLGGLARAVQEAADILDAAGKQRVFLETVGVGQSELAVAQSCDTCVVVMVPEAGGVVQAMKAGLMEIAEIFVVNKSDRPAADEMQRQLIEAASLIKHGDRRPPVVKTAAVTGEGVSELYREILKHRAWLQEGDRLERKRLQQNQARIRDLVRVALEDKLWTDDLIANQLIDSAELVRTGQIGLQQATGQVWRVVLERLGQATPDSVPSLRGVNQ